MDILWKSSFFVTQSARGGRTTYSRKDFTKTLLILNMTMIAFVTLATTLIIDNQDSVAGASDEDKYDDGCNPRCTMTMATGSGLQARALTCHSGTLSVCTH